MLRRFVIAFVLCSAPSAALAESAMPQMDFQNPLTVSQIWWMAVILVALYFCLSRWGLPQIGTVLEERSAKITADLQAARAAKMAADEAVIALNATVQRARHKAQADIAEAAVQTKAKALADAKALNAKLDAQLAYSETQIAEARLVALAAIKPVAADTAASILSRLVGKAPEENPLAHGIEAAFAKYKSA